MLVFIFDWRFLYQEGSNKKIYHIFVLVDDKAKILPCNKTFEFCLE